METVQKKILSSRSTTDHTLHHIISVPDWLVLAGDVAGHGWPWLGLAGPSLPWLARPI